jgi:DNA (cytosine-5)-methyltransferase 1
MKHFGDITKIHGYDVPPVDIITGGSPCQDLSVAGKRAGLAGERSGLFMDQIRIVKEMRNESKRRLSIRGADYDIRYIKPRYMVWENVAGAFSSGNPKGADFQAVLEEIVKIVCKECPDIPIPRGGWRYAGCIEGVGDDGIPFSISWRLHDAQFWGVPQRRRRISLVADFGGTSASKILFECKGLSGDIKPSKQEREEIAESVGRSTNTTSYTLKIRGGIETDANGHKAGKGALIQTELSGTLGVVQDQTLFQNIPNAMVFDAQRRHNYEPFGDVSETVQAQYGTGGNNVPLVVQDNPAIAISHDLRSARFSLDDKCDPLTSTDYKEPMKVYYKSIVRKLTPLECERLQGFPDEWTNIGEWKDSKGKLHKNADAPRYKALGNSIALPFWEWMAGRMCDCLRSEGYENLTMASLFDGIGGFPLVYQRNGCEPVWASEIEEFPIAVTKFHFGEK